MADKTATILCLPTELQTQILSYLPYLDQMHCMGITPLWCTILQSESLKAERYYDSIYPKTHRLIFEEYVQIDLHTSKGKIDKVSIWKRPPYFKEQPEYILARIDMNSDEPSLLKERLFGEDFSGLAPKKIRKLKVHPIEVILCIFSPDPVANKVSWTRKWILFERQDVGFESMTIADFLEFLKGVVAASEDLGAESTVVVKFTVTGWKRTRLDVMVSIKDQVA
ncbi:hypothetical protein TWF730_008064 [Orbilia blumenaviensis]|uniref:F-box domain-containing protein n=1 Tax=Orbilia blumenaviensis TaxID=1796055 RepID=A0AAV9VBE7_9PEZI